jgi:elongation factor Ts
MSKTNGSPVRASQIQELREQTGAGIMECKKALEETGGDLGKAKDRLRDRGVALAAKREGREASKGLVGAYIHSGGGVGTLLELNCETDFVARTEDFQNLVKELCMQIAAMRPRWVSRDQVPADVLLEKRREFEAEALNDKKPAPVSAKIAEGKLDKYLSDFCLLDQPYVREPSGKVKIKDLLTEAAAKMGENIVVRRFVRYEVGKD